MKGFLLLLLCGLAATLANARGCFDRPGRRRANVFRNDKWLRKYDTIRVVTSDFHYLPSFLAASGEKYGSVSGTSTVKMLAGRSCAPYAMSASGMFELSNPPSEFMQGDRRFNSHLHEGTCDELDKTGKSTNGLGNHYQHIPSKSAALYLFIQYLKNLILRGLVCLQYSSTPAAGSAGYADTKNCLNADAPGAVRRGSVPFEMWPTYFGVEGDNHTFKVGSLTDEADDLVDCPTPCRRNRCVNCQTRSVPWWPAPGVPVSIAVHDTAAAASGSGAIMLCAEITGLATEEAACTAAGIDDCRVTDEEDLKASRFCSYSISPFLPKGTSSPCT